MTKFPYR